MIQGSDLWKKWRSEGLGASEIAAVVGVCPYKTPYQLWLEKTGRAKGFEGNSLTQHGQETEAKARARYELLTMEDMPPACATHPKYEICRASLDGLKADNSLVLEIKCPMGAATLDAARAGKVPEHYAAQVQYQLAVTGADLLHFFVYHAGTEQDALVEVKPDIKHQGELIAAALEFWKLVKSDTPPPLTERDVKVVTSDGIRKICARLKQLKDLTDKVAKKESDELKAQVIELGGHNKVRCDDVLVSKSILKTGKASFRLTITEVKNEPA